MINRFESFKRRLVRGYYKRRVKQSWDAKDIPCPLCGNNADFKTLFDHDRYGLPIKTVECPVCGLVFTRPFPTEKFLNKFYSSRMFRGLDWGVLKIDKETKEEFSAPGRARKHVAYIKELIGRGLIKNFHSILDVGSSEGTFLIECKKAFPGLRLCGVEPGGNFRFLSEKELDAVYESIESIPAGEKFDCITLWHVLEHVGDPAGILKEAKSRLNPSGVLIIEVPDLLRYDGIRTIHVDHVFHFSEKTLKKFLEDAGFEFLESNREERFLMDGIYGMKVSARVR